MHTARSRESQPSLGQQLLSEMASRESRFAQHEQAFDDAVRGLSKAVSDAKFTGGGEWSAAVQEAAAQFRTHVHLPWVRRRADGDDPDGKPESRRGSSGAAAYGGRNGKHGPQQAQDCQRKGATAWHPGAGELSCHRSAPLSTPQISQSKADLASQKKALDQLVASASRAGAGGSAGMSVRCIAVAGLAPHAATHTPSTLAA